MTFQTNCKETSCISAPCSSFPSPSHPFVFFRVIPFAHGSLPMYSPEALRERRYRGKKGGGKRSTVAQNLEKEEEDEDDDEENEASMITSRRCSSLSLPSLPLSRFASLPRWHIGEGGSFDASKKISCQSFWKGAWPQERPSLKSDTLLPHFLYCQPLLSLLSTPRGEATHRYQFGDPKGTREGPEGGPRSPKKQS